MGANTMGTGSEATGADTGFTTNVGAPLPGSPADAMGLDVMPPSGGVGAADPGTGEDLTGDDQEHDRNLVDEGAVVTASDLKPRLVEDINPEVSNVSGPTPLEEDRGS